jgi:hypothetical protein
MSRVPLAKAIIIILITFIFVKIHQHNRCISLSYKQQKLEQKKKKLTLEKNHLLAKLACLKNRDDLRRWAQEEKKMTSLSLSHVVQLTQ